jgi:Uncharacterized Fe-S protein
MFHGIRIISANCEFIKWVGTIVVKISSIDAYDQLCKLLLDYPDSLYGFSDVPDGQFYNQYNSVLVIAVPHEKIITLQNYSEESFENNTRMAYNKLGTILGNVLNFLLRESISYYVPPVTQTSEKTLIAPFSFKYAAVRAGIGWIGKNDVLITKEYGPRVSLSAVFIDYSFPKGTPVTLSKCSYDCFLCIKSCPYNCITGKQWNIEMQRNELIDYQLCNQKRSEFLKTHDRKNACGLCMAACPVGL